MITSTVAVLNQKGLHARPSVNLAKEACRFQSQILIVKEEQRVSARDVLQLLSLGAQCGTILTVEVIGEDEKEAMQAITELFANELGYHGD
jgi:phosphocarrier protein